MFLSQILSPVDCPCQCLSRSQHVKRSWQNVLLSAGPRLVQLISNCSQLSPEGSCSPVIDPAAGTNRLFRWIKTQKSAFFHLLPQATLLYVVVFIVTHHTRVRADMHCTWGWHQTGSPPLQGQPGGRPHGSAVAFAPPSLFSKKRNRIMEIIHTGTRERTVQSLISQAG